jgi:DHA2 family multidrug resistance protein-like MFS transporter
MAALMVSIALAILDTAIANTALPSIARNLNAEPGPSIWIINSYQLAAVATLLPFAALGGAFGHRRVYVGGLVLFTVASAGCAFSTSLAQLVAARVVQGIGASAIMSVNTALIATLYPKPILGRGLGLNALVVGVSFALGPTAASLILSVGSWHLLFAVNVPIGVVATAFSLYTLPHSRNSSANFDIPAAVLTTIAFASLIYGLGAIAQGDPMANAMLAISVFAISLVALASYERGRQSPMLPLDLLKRPLFALSALTGFCAFAAQSLAFVALPFHLEHAFGFSAEETGFILTPWSAVVALMAPVAGRLSDRFESGYLGLLGLGSLAISIFVIALLPSSTPLLVLLGCMVLSGIGFGLFQAPNQKAIMSSAPDHRASGASGVVATARLIGQTTGAALVAFSFGISGEYGPNIALLLGAGFALAGGLASATRLSNAARLR